MHPENLSAMGINEVFEKANKTKYKCHSDNKSLWCNQSVGAKVPPPKNRIHICPNFFERWNEDQQVGTILHEMFHLWSGPDVDYISEKYCWQIDINEEKPENLIKIADQYMLFIWNLDPFRQNELKCF